MYEVKVELVSHCLNHFDLTQTFASAGFGLGALQDGRTKTSVQTNSGKPVIPGNGWHL